MDIYRENIVYSESREKLASKYGVGLQTHLVESKWEAARAVQFSKLKWFYEPEGNEAIPFTHAFYMATKEGGALFGNVGSLERGYVFDALVIRDFSDPFRGIEPEETVERFCYTGTAADIKARFINGIGDGSFCVKKSTQKEPSPTREPDSRR